ncbi:hypothetical protein GCM10017608_09920 [Agromyces luteolus]|nr:hypothetical protein GCM10017608_09920 [Agromyces luteolus]
MHVTPGSNAKVVGCAKDLKPFRVRLLRYMSPRCRGVMVLDASDERTRADAACPRSPAVAAVIDPD